MSFIFLLKLDVKKKNLLKGSTQRHRLSLNTCVFTYITPTVGENICLLLHCGDLIVTNYLKRNNYIF